jgi:multiple sugar transport system ATP-binding protein
MIAGLETSSAGEMWIGDRNVTRLSPKNRNIAMVFQSYALYPHMSVRENLGFALRLQRLSKAEIAAAVGAAAATLDIAHLLDRKPRELSGGQRQRVAIGRAIVRQPAVFLLDEPLSNLDAALRVRMRYEFAALHDKLGATMVYVTHDQIEAMTLADRIVVLNQGRIEQVGTPQDLYDRPATRFVAGFIGTPQMTLFGGRLAETSAERALVTLPDGSTLHAPPVRGVSPGAAVTIGVRPEHVAIAGEVNRRRGAVRFIESLGGTHLAYLDLPGLAEPLTWQTSTRLASGDAVSITLPPERLHLFDGEGAAIATEPEASQLAQKDSWRQAANERTSVS